MGFMKILYSIWCLCELWSRLTVKILMYALECGRDGHACFITIFIGLNIPPFLWLLPFYCWLNSTNQSDGSLIILFLPFLRPRKIQIATVLIFEKALPISLHHFEIHIAVFVREKAASLFFLIDVDFAHILISFTRNNKRKLYWFLQYLISIMFYQIKVITLKICVLLVILEEIVASMLQSCRRTWLRMGMKRSWTLIFHQWPLILWEENMSTLLNWSVSFFNLDLLDLFVFYLLGLVTNSFSILFLHEAH